MWSLFSRAIFVYALQYLISFGRLGWVPGLGFIDLGIRKPETALYQFIQRFVLHTPPSTGYRADDAALSSLNSMVLFPVAIALVWLLLDRRRRREAGVHEAARLVCRYFLATMCLGYAGEKFFGNQGGWALRPDNLVLPSGEINGVTAMMTWLSYSTLYAWFAGWAEAAAGLLLFSRRWTTLGAALCLADMGMVWLINQSYWDDWGGASFTPIHFVTPALFLLAPHAGRFLDFLVRGRATVIRFVRVDVPRWLWSVGNVIKPILIIWLVYVSIEPSFQLVLVHRNWSSLYGVYRVERFERNGVLEPLAS
jgi:uncharacterized membrane protein YphA (DoxX/SURF4 family)